MSSSTSRYAIYFTPHPESALAVFGARLLGYDPDKGLPVAQMELSGVDREDLAAATEAPRRYGFHATIAAPFYLGDGPEEKLIERFRVFCNRARPAQLGRLAVTTLDHFVALTPVTACADVDDLARDCVTFFDSLRAPPSAKDLARRDDGSLTPRERDYLHRWGYPYVFEEFRFHMSLTGRLSPGDRDRYMSALSEVYQPLSEGSYELDALSLLRQDDPESRFRVVIRENLKGANVQSV